MKNYILTLSCILACLSASSQITFLFSVPATPVYHIQLQQAGHKLVSFDGTNNQILIFNFNGSLYKTINIPPITGALYANNIYYLSEDLFDTDPSNLEFVQSYLVGPAPNYVNHVRILREDGTLLFSKDSMAFAFPIPSLNDETNNDPPIFKKGTITYMKITSTSYSSSSKNEFYKLPGHLFPGIMPQFDRTTEDNENSNNIYALPNPSSNATKVFYQLPQGVSEATLILSDLNGNVVKQFQVSKLMEYISISTADLPAGTYIYTIQTSSELIKSSNLVVIH